MMPRQHEDIPKAVAFATGTPSMSEKDNSTEKVGYRGVYVKRKKEAKDLEEAFLAGTGPSTTAASQPDLRHSILVIRHGKTALDPIHRSDGWLDFPLSDDGRTKLITAQQYLKDAAIVHIYAPTLKRTMETAHILQSGIISNPDVIPSDDAKTWNLGLLAGTPKKPNKPAVQYYMEHRDVMPEGGESYNDFHSRFTTWFKKIQENVRAGKGPVLLVLSGSNIRDISAELTGNDSTLDLDEGGLLLLRPVNSGWSASVVFGSKDQQNEWLS